MKVGEVLSRSIDVVSKNPVILVPYIVPAILNLIDGIILMRQTFWVRHVPTFEIMTPGETMKFWQGMMPFLPMTGTRLLLSFLTIIFSVVATAMAIVITLDSLKGKKSTLSGAFNMVKDKFIVLIIATFVVTILAFLGLCALIVGAIIVHVLLIFVSQAIVVDGLSFGESFSKSYKIAKSNFFDVFLVLLVFGVIGFIVSLIPIPGNALNPFIGAFSTAALTILYLDRKNKIQDVVEKEMIFSELLKNFETTENLRQELQTYLHREIPDLTEVSLEELKEFQKMEKNR